MISLRFLSAAADCAPQDDTGVALARSKNPSRADLEPIGLALALFEIKATTLPPAMGARDDDVPKSSTA